jgi:DNA-binding protein
MPTVNIFYTSEGQREQYKRISADFKSYLATELSCKDINLTSEEVSLRLIKTVDGGMIAPIEVEVTVHAFDERIKRQDEIANNIRQFLLNKIDIEDVRVWVLLPQLGHSW